MYFKEVTYSAVNEFIIAIKCWYRLLYSAPSRQCRLT